MSTEVALRSSEVPASFAEQMHMATVLSDSSLLPAHLRGKPANVLVILQGARALDVSAFWALQSMHVVEGKLGLSAELMRALVNKAGHKFTVKVRTAEKAVVEIHRKDKAEPYTAEFTAEDAKTAELLGKGNWKKYVKSMLVARATSIAVRDECPEVMFGMVYTPEELGADTDREGNPIYSQDGKVVMDGTVVEKASAEDLSIWAEALEVAPLNLLANVWTKVKDRGAAFETPGDRDDSLYDLLTYRIMAEAVAARCRPEVRDLFNMAKLLGMLDAPTGEGETLRDYIVQRGNEVPEECPSDDATGSAGAPEAPGEGDAPAEPQKTAQRAEDIATPEAEALRAAAAESWAEESAVLVGEVMDK